MTATRLADDSFKGEAVPAFRLASASGLSAVISAYGGRLLSLHIPDGGKGADVVMGTPPPRHFADGDRYAGAICGRYANRIRDAQFSLDGVRHRLTPNEGANQLHGGPDSFSDRVWTAEIDGDSIVLSLSSADGDQGFPGRLDVTARYRLVESVLSLTLEARSNAPTVVNLTQHAYWNLAGSGDMSDHNLMITAERYTPVDGANIPMGESQSIAGTDFNFLSPRSLGEALRRRPEGFDHNFCLLGQRGELNPAAHLEHPRSGRVMALWTTEPGLQVYTAQHFGPGILGKPGQKLRRFGAIALEPQTWPDSPNRPAFPSAVLRPGETYRHHMEWRFGWA